VLGFNEAMSLPASIAGVLSTKGLEFWEVAAESLVGVVPLVVLAAFISRFPIRGLTMGAIKE
jgi:ABC-type glycerol-3-phosphate transport system permease component